MKVELRRINIEKIKKNTYIKYDIKNKIFKTLCKNQNISPVKKIFLRTFLKSKSLKYSFLKQNNCCLITGRFKGYQKKYGMSRHSLKKFGLYGNVQNTNTQSW